MVLTEPRPGLGFPLPQPQNLPLSVMLASSTSIIDCFAHFPSGHFNIYVVVLGKIPVTTVKCSPQGLSVFYYLENPLGSSP